jgi:hypothetical protein
MPCRDGGPPGPSLEDQYKQRLDLATRLLCALCAKLDKAGLTKRFLTKELRSWWEQHQEQDRIRKEREEADAASGRTRQRAIAKLTPAERKALDIDDE